MGKTYLVTGGAGYVGFTVLKLLTTSCSEDVDLVKVLDLAFPPALVEELEAKSKGVALEWNKCDVTKADEVRMAMSGCDTVLHLAGILPGSAQREKMWDVNVTGTNNVVQACCQAGVTSLVHISSVNAVGPNMHAEPGIMLEEDSDYNIHPTSWYGKSKKKAEEIVLEANGRKNKDGEVLTTCSIRPPRIYGEDFSRMQRVYHSSKRSKTILALLGQNSEFSNIYVGNLAWAILDAAKKMREKRELVGGEAYFIKDNTPDMQIDNFTAKLFSTIGFKLSRQPIAPFWLIYLVYTILEIVVTILRTLKVTTKRMAERYLVWTSNTKFTVSNRKFVEHFGYVPKFTYEVSLNNTRSFIKRMAESDFASRVYDYDL